MNVIKLIAIPVVLFAVGALVGPFIMPPVLRFCGISKSTNVATVRIRPVLDAQWRRMLVSENSDPKFQAFQAKATAMQQKLDAKKCRFSNEMETLKANFAGGLAKWHEQRRQEIESAVTVVAEERGYHLVYCDALEVEHWSDLRCHFSQYVNNERWTPACLLPSDDITDQVIDMMKRLDEAKNSSKVP